VKILSLREAASIAGVADVEVLFQDGDWQYPDRVPSLAIPTTPGRLLNLARVVAAEFLGSGPVLVWITGTGVWVSSEHMDLFDGYRRGQGDPRTIYEAPLQRFDAGETDALVSTLWLGLCFGWDLELVALDQSLAMTFSHDGWFEYRVGGESRSLIPGLQARLAHLEVSDPREASSAGAATLRGPPEAVRAHGPGGEDAPAEDPLVEVYETKDHGTALVIGDIELADRFEDFLTEDRFVLFQTTMEPTRVLFHFGQAGSPSRARALFERFRRGLNGT